MFYRQLLMVFVVVLVVLATSTPGGIMMKEMRGYHRTPTVSDQIAVAYRLEPGIMGGTFKTSLRVLYPEHGSLWIKKGEHVSYFRPGSKTAEETFGMIHVRNSYWLSFTDSPELQKANHVVLRLHYTMSPQQVDQLVREKIDPADLDHELFRALWKRIAQEELVLCNSESAFKKLASKVLIDARNDVTSSKLFRCISDEKLEFVAK